MRLISSFYQYIAISLPYRYLLAFSYKHVIVEKCDYGDSLSFREKNMEQKRTVTERAAMARLRRRLFGGDKAGHSNTTGYYRVRAGLYSEGHSRAEFEQWLRAAGALADFEVLEGTP